MTRSRYSISKLMAGVLVAGAIFAAFRSGSIAWAAAFWFGVILLLGRSLLGIIYRRDSARAWNIGFALFGGGYLVLLASDWGIEGIGLRGVTAIGLDAIYERWGETGSETTPVLSSPPASPSRYLEAATKLVAKGDIAMADKYVSAAFQYRDLLSGAEKSRLRYEFDGLLTYEMRRTLDSEVPHHRSAIGGTLLGFRRIAQAILTLLMAVLGGIIARRLYARSTLPSIHVDAESEVKVPIQ